MIYVIVSGWKSQHIVSWETYSPRLQVVEAIVQWNIEVQQQKNWWHCKKKWYCLLQTEYFLI